MRNLVASSSRLMSMILRPSAVRSTVEPAGWAEDWPMPRETSRFMDVSSIRSPFTRPPSQTPAQIYGGPYHASFESSDRFRHRLPPSPLLPEGLIIMLRSAVAFLSLLLLAAASASHAEEAR